MAKIAVWGVKGDKSVAKSGLKGNHFDFGLQYMKGCGGVANWYPFGYLCLLCVYFILVQGRKEAAVKTQVLSAFALVGLVGSALGGSFGLDDG